MSVAFVFPGQGSQSVGMLSSLGHRPEVAALLQMADQVLAEPISRLIEQGPAEELALTVNTQPAMLLAGLACLAAWRAAGGFEPEFVAGHSLGEYTALTAADALDPAAAVALVRLRARAMQEAVPHGVGAMAAILGLTDEQVAQACDQARTAADGGLEVVDPANFNAPSQVVIAGHKAAVDRACAAAKAMGAKRAVLLPVSAPFHSSLLASAGSQLQQALAKIELRPPRIPMVNNVDVALESDVARIKDALVRQAYGPVRWVELVRFLTAAGVDHFIEFGPGKVLSGLIRRVAPQARIDAVHDAASLESTLQQTGGASRMSAAGNRDDTLGDDAPASARQEGASNPAAAALAGEVALVTGASRGIGAAVARALAQNGALVIGTSTSQAGADRIRESLPGASYGVVLEVNDSLACEALVERILKEHQRLSVLVNNAGITRDSLAMRMKDADWLDVINTNLSSVFRLCRLAIRPMMKQRHGRIINITSVVGSSGNPGQSNYAAAKAGVAGMSRALAREIGSRGITVNCVAPGFIDTDMTRELAPEQVAALTQQIPLGRLGQADDIAAACVFLASAGAGYITGVTLPVNGGMHMA